MGIVFSFCRSRRGITVIVGEAEAMVVVVWIERLGIYGSSRVTARVLSLVGVVQRASPSAQPPPSKPRSVRPKHVPKVAKRRTQINMSCLSMIIRLPGQPEDARARGLDPADHAPQLYTQRCTPPQPIWFFRTICGRHRMRAFAVVLLLRNVPALARRAASSSWGGGKCVIIILCFRKRRNRTHKHFTYIYFYITAFANSSPRRYVYKQPICYICSLCLIGAFNGCGMENATVVSDIVVN